MASPLPLPKKRGRKIVLIILALLAIPIVLAAGWRWNLKRDVNTRLEAIRVAGLPTSGAELNEYYPSVPDEENAALILAEAFALMTHYPDARSNDVRKFEFPSPREPLTDEETELLSGYVRMNQPALAKAREGLSLPRCRYPIDLTDGLNALLPHLPALRNLAQVASFEGILSADAGQPEEAVESIITILDLSRTLMEEPLLISQLIRFYMHRMVKESIERSLGEVPLNDLQLSALRQNLEAAAGDDGMVRAMISERAMAVPYFRMTYSEFVVFPDSFSANRIENGEGLLPSALTLLIRATGFFERDLRFYLRAMETNIALAGQPHPAIQASENFEGANYAIARNGHIISAMILPSLSKALVRNAESRANIRLAQTALAVEQCRISQNRLPSELSELIPNYLSEIPIDPFDGAPLRFKALPTGYVIWSVGQDGMDDGGKPKPSETSQRGSGNYDLAFVVER